MGLTIILPSISNRELITKLKKQKKEDDELFCFKSSSASIKRKTSQHIADSKNDDILIVNPRDDMCLRQGFINLFKDEGLIISNLKYDGELSPKSSLKFNKSLVDQIPEDVRCRNIKEIITHIYNQSNEIGKPAKLSKSPEQSVNEEGPVNEEREQPKQKTTHVNTSELRKKKSSGKPSILFICDVKGWAGGIKSEYIQKYLSDEFDIDIIHVIGKDKQKVDSRKYDLYFTFGYSYVHYIKDVPFNKRITGLTAHRSLKSIQPQIKKAYAVHANSQMLVKDAKKIHDNVFYVPNGVDTDLFYKHHESDILTRDYINVGHIGKSAKMKQQKTVIEPVVEKLGEQYNYIYHYNNYTNRIDHRDMPNMYQDMDLFIIASLEDGTPNPGLEAMACEVPVISNRIGNMPEIIENGYNGYIVENPTIDNYVSLISSLSKEHLLEMGRNARRTILEGWTWEYQAENYRYMFRKLLGKQ